MPKYIIKYTEGNTVGPFNVYLSGSSGLSLYAANVTKDQLLGGFVVSFDDGIPSSSVLVDNINYACDTEQLLPFPTTTPSITPSISITPSVSPTPTATPSVTPTVTPTISVTPSVTPPPSISISKTPSVTPSASPGASPSPTPSISITPTPSITPSTPSSYRFLGTTIHNAGYMACYLKQCTETYYLRNSVPSIGDVVYIDPGCTTFFDGSNFWIAITLNCTGPWMSFQVNNLGVISSDPEYCL